MTGVDLPASNPETWNNGEVHTWRIFGKTDPLSPDTDRAMVCGNLAFNLEIKEMLEEYGLVEGANSNPQQYVVEKAFLD